MDIGKDYYLHYWAQKLIMTFPQFLSSSSNTVAQKSPKTEHVNMMWRVCHVCKKYSSLDCAMQCPRWPGVINDRDYCDTESAACCSYLEFVFSVWCLVQISGLEGGGRGGAGQQIILCTHRTTHNTAGQSGTWTIGHAHGPDTGQLQWRGNRVKRQGTMTLIMNKTSRVCPL